MLRFFADESGDFAIVRGLRAIGFDVRAVVEDMPGVPDPAVLKAAVSENRILLTEDKDFGKWVFAHKSATAGVVLIRYPSNMRSVMMELIVELVNRHGNELLGKFTVLEPGRARIRSVAK
jgi:predicted nuclease of predicted toxin-antitoxin system